LPDRKFPKVPNMTPYNPVNAGGSKVPLILDRERIRFVYGEDQSQSSKPKFRR
jgi:hypothetical protein